MSRRLRFFLVAMMEVLLLAATGAAFWYQDWRYAQPTPRPADWQGPQPGQALALPGGILPRDGRPTLLHFFNPNCPCSRFNFDHLRELIRRFGADVNFVAVLETDADSGTLNRFHALGCQIPALVDDGQISRATGVYSTPQAVILDGDGRLYYRGNYNLGRYCVDPKTEFARLALEALLAGRPCPEFPRSATAAYGCPLPDSTAGVERRESP